jgi:asparagine synthase (glutamine-hydrolysing)
MCGILGIFGIKGEYHEVRALACALSHRMKHRGPDDAGIIIQKDANGAYNIICHQRLSILDTSSNGR